MLDSDDLESHGFIQVWDPTKLDSVILVVYCVKEAPIKLGRQPIHYGQDYISAKELREANLHYKALFEVLSSKYVIHSETKGELNLLNAHVKDAIRNERIWECEWHLIPRSNSSNDPEYKACTDIEGCRHHMHHPGHKRLWLGQLTLAIDPIRRWEQVTDARKEAQNSYVLCPRHHRLIHLNI